MPDQFLYTYQPRLDEHERLKRRLEAGFGRDRQLRRFYLDLTDLPEKLDKPRYSGTDSISATNNGLVYEPVSSLSGPGGRKRTGASCEAVAHFVPPPGNDPNDGQWELCTMITAYAQALGTLWLKLPLTRLEIADLPRKCARGQASRRWCALTKDDRTAPRILYVDDEAASVPWGWLGTLPLSSETVLCLRNIALNRDRDVDNLDPRHLIFDNCYLNEVCANELLGRFHHLETLVLFETFVEDFTRMLVILPTTVRRVHVLQQDVHFPDP